MNRLYEIYAAIFARPPLYRFNRFLLKLSLRGIGISNWTTENLRGERAALEKILTGERLGGVVLDVGANEGEYTRIVHAISSTFRIYAFEPHPITFERLRANVAGLDNVSCHNIALGSKIDRTLIFDYAGTNGSPHASLYQSVIEDVHGRDSESHIVEIITLDRFLDDLGISDVRLLKIDVEGAELEVLRGASRFLNDGSKSIEFIQIEFNEMNVAARVFLQDILHMLPGYRCYRILPRGGLIDLTDENIGLREIFAYQIFSFLVCRSSSRSP